MLIRKRNPHHRGERTVPAPFIVGTGRCGSTLLRLMLDAHPELCIPPETHFIGRLIDSFAERPSVSADDFVQVLTGHYTWPDFHLDERDLRNEIGTARTDLASGLRAFYRCCARRQGKPRWGDKTPDYLHRMTAIQHVLPEAHFVHIIRDCRDVVLSVSKLWFGPNDVEGAAVWWRDQIESARRQADRLGAYYEIRYEDLVANPSGELAALVGYLDLPFSPEMLAYDRRASSRLDELTTVQRGTSTVSKEMRLAALRYTNLPPRADCVHPWRKEMHPEDLQAVNRIAGGLLSSLGYEVT